MTGTRYRLVRSDGQTEEEGQGDVLVGPDALTLTLSRGDVLRLPSGLITAAGAGDGLAVRVALADGTVIELTQLGRMRTQLLAELRDGRATQAAAGAAVTGDPEVFTAHDGDGPAEARLYDDALLVVGPAACQRIGYSFIGDVSVADYTVTVTGPGRPPLVLSSLGRRTTEFAGLLSARYADAHVRTSTLLAALLPRLAPDLLRRASAELRDGVAVPVAALDRIAPGAAATLLQLVTVPERRDAVAELGRRTELALGFHQVRSVRRAAVGTTPWRDPAVTPHIGDHGSWAGGGLGWGYGGYGGFFGGNPDWWRAMTPRADVHRGQLIPATEDLAVLTTAGDQPTVIAFVLGRTADRVVFDIISQPGAGTWVYRAAGPDGLALINRELDNAGFNPPTPDRPGGGGAGPEGSGDGPGAGTLAEMLAGWVEPGPDWAARLGPLLNETGRPGQAGRPGETGRPGEPGRPS